jgi:hypothetical protein
MLASADYELKLLIDPDRTLDAGGDPTTALRASFAIDERQKVVMQFLDSARLELERVQWNVRIRAFRDEDKLQLTYKKRYPISENDIDTALARAVEDGFEADSEAYEAQVEWGFERKTLSISRKTELASSESDPLDLPGERKSREICTAAIPSRLEQEASQAWVRAVFEHAHLYGPVSGDRWKGKWNGKKVSIEVWQIRGEPGNEDERVVEVSLKEDDRDDARAIQAELQTFLEEKNWLLPRDALKTTTILERY